VEWNPSKQLVSASGESLLISFRILVFMRISCIFSYAFVPKERKNRLKSYSYKVKMRNKDLRDFQVRKD